MQRFLLIQTAFLGDVVLATALAEKLHDHYPGATIDFLVRKGNEGLLSSHPFLGKVLVFDKKEKTRSLRQLLRTVRARRYDVVVNVQRFFSSGLIAVLSNARQIIGFDKNPLSFGFTHRIPHHIDHQSDNPPHEVFRNLRLIEHLTDDSLVRPRLYPPEKSYQKVARDHPYVCLAPTSVWYTKQWPAEKWISLIDQIDTKLEVILIGGPADRAACEDLKTQTHHPWVNNLAGELNLLDSAALMENAVMNFANDSAPVHLASAVNAPITEIYCSTVPAFGFTPLSDRSRVVETTLDLDCRPCGLHGHRACPEGHFKCAKTITTDQVLVPEVSDSQSGRLL